MKNSLLSILLLLSVCLNAQDKPAIESALKTFDDASDLIGMKQAVAEMKEVSDKNQGDWYSAYWTSFFYSQTGRLTQTAKAYYDSAQMYFDRAMEAHPKQSEVEASDFHALQSLIHDLNASTYFRTGDQENGLKLTSQANTSLNLAIKTNPNNPRVYLLSGTDLISNGQRTQNNGWVLAGKELLEKAKTLYASEKPSLSIAPNWGSGWINFWLSRVQLN